jgi:hypothetical protein
MKRKLKIMANLLLTAAFVAVFASCSKGSRAIKTPGGYRIETVLIPKGTFLMGSSDGSAVGKGAPGTDPNATPADLILEGDQSLGNYGSIEDFLDFCTDEGYFGAPCDHTYEYIIFCPYTTFYGKI